MNKRTIKAGTFRRHYATNGILMYRERKKPITVPEGTMVTILKARRQSHLATVRCIADAEGNLTLGSGRKAVDICVAIETEFLPKLKIEGAEVKATTAKGGKKGSRKGSKTATAVGPVEAVAVGVGPADIGAEQPAGEQPANPAIEVAPAQPAAAIVEPAHEAAV